MEKPQENQEISDETLFDNDSPKQTFTDWMWWGIIRLARVRFRIPYIPFRELLHETRQIAPSP